MSKGERFLAGLFSFIAPGAGQAYAGQFARGIFLAMAGVLVGVLSLRGLLALPSFWSVALPLALVFAYRIWAAIDAYRLREVDPDRFIINRVSNVILVVAATYGVSLFAGAPRMFYFEDAYELPSNSMAPLLLTGDYLITIPMVAEPERRQLVVFLQPADTTVSYVKRVIGIPGDTIEMRDGGLLLNGRRFSEPYAHHTDPGIDPVEDRFAWQSRYLVPRPRASYVPSRNNWGPLLVPAQRYFLLGDNRDNSFDSRHMGFIPRDLIVAAPRRVYFSRDSVRGVRWSRLGQKL